MLALSIASLPVVLCSQTPSSSDDHHHSVEMHGDQEMGFPHDKTTHHFKLSQSGGTIEVIANEPNDHADIEAIQSHLMHIAMMFKSGDFSAPIVIHSTTPPGVPTMKRLRDKIQYNYEPMTNGARVKIVSSDPEAIAAVKDFLRFQITDHVTGDSTVTGPPVQ